MRLPTNPWRLLGGPLLLAILLSSALATPAVADGRAQADIRGLWTTDSGEAKVRIEPCGEGAAAERLCGRIEWLEEPLEADGSQKRDDENPDPALRDREILGLAILEGFPVRPDAKGVYSGGTIYDPENGKTYSCKITPSGDDELKIRGFIGVSLLGRTTVWTRSGGAGSGDR